VRIKVADRRGLGIEERKSIYIKEQGVESRNNPVAP